MAKAKSSEELQLENIRLMAVQRRVLMERDECETSLRTFVRCAWSSIEAVPYVHGRHIDAICEHLEAVSNGEIRQLIINLPPRHMKSGLISVLWPAWEWIKKPEIQWLFASYSESLSIALSRKCRNLIRSNWYQQAWGENYKIVSDQNEKRRFENNKSGYRLATSVDGTNTGEGAQRLIYDDPNNVRTVESDAVRESVNDWHDQVMTTRLNNPKTGCRVVVQQRSHERDMTGHLLEKGGWEHLVLPAEYEGSIKTTSIGWSDWRKKEKDLLWPEMYDREALDVLKKDLRELGTAGQLQQRPSPGEGAKYKRHWWEFYNPLNVTTGKVRVKNPGGEFVEKAPITIPSVFEQVVHGWDMTFKNTKGTDLVAGHAWGRVGSNVFLLARDSGHYDFPQTLAAVRKMSVDFPCPEKMVEDKANGPAVIQTLRNEIPGIIASPIDGGLEALANSMSGYAEAGNVYLPNPDLFPWVWEIIEQYAMFPNGRHDDDIAAASHAMRRLFDSASNSGVPEFRVMPRLGEPTSACHIVEANRMVAELPPNWRRWIAISPGEIGAVLWVCETPTGGFRVYRELDLEGLDASEVGRRIAEATLPDLKRFMQSISFNSRFKMDVMLEKEAFEPIEPMGCYAEMMELGLMGYDPTHGSFEERQAAKAWLKKAQFSTQIGVVEDTAFDRLRELLRFKPPDYEVLPFDRKKMFELADKDMTAYQSYMNAVHEIIPGEYPRLKISSDCKKTIAALGSIRRDAEISDSFMRALLIAMTAPPSVSASKKIRLTPAHLLKPAIPNRVARFR